jgi:hypothetical protein
MGRFATFLAVGWTDDAVPKTVSVGIDDLPVNEQVLRRIRECQVSLSRLLDFSHLRDEFLRRVEKRRQDMAILAEVGLLSLRS